MQSGSFFEPLEGRRLLSAAVNMVGDTLVVVSDDSSSTIGVDQASAGAPFVVSINGVPTGQQYPGVNHVQIIGGNGGQTLELTTYSADGTILGGNGNDTITVNNASSMTVQALGGNGNDILHGNTIPGSGGLTVLDGGNGDDQLFGDQGSVKIFAGNGNDAIWLKAQCSAIIDAGRGTDAVTLTLDVDPFGNQLDFATINHTSASSGAINVFSDAGLTNQIAQDQFVNAENVQVVVPPPLF
jgi:Ca2+-binding RTX toxin-like protein